MFRQRCMHGQGLRDALIRLNGIRDSHADPIGGQRRRPHLGTAQGRGQRPNAGLTHHIENVPEEIGLNDPSLIIDLINLAVAQIERFMGCGNPEPVTAHRAAVMAKRCDVAAALIRAADKNGVATFEIGNRQLQRSKRHGLAAALPACSLIGWATRQTACA